jgi:preprotein translocase subunit YajC
MTTPLSFPVFLAQDGGGAIVPGGGTPPAGEVQSTTTTPGTTTPPGSPGGSPSTNPFGGMFVPLIVVMVVLVLMTTMGGRKEKKKRAELLASVAKNDQVQTVGGVIGTVIELNEATMVLRVDEASNTRVRFARSAIQQVLRSSRDKPDGTDVEVKPAVPARV